MKRQVKCPRCGYVFEVLSKRSPGMGAQEGVSARIGPIKMLVLYALWSKRALDPGKAMSNMQIWYTIHDEMLKHGFTNKDVPRFNTVQGRVSDLLGDGKILAVPEHIKMGYSQADQHVKSKSRFYYYLTNEAADYISAREDKYFWDYIASARRRRSPSAKLF
jgi:hypothetical protein